MYAERRKAFSHRIGELLGDHQRAIGGKFSKAAAFDLGARIQSALEDAYQMGLRQVAPQGPIAVAEGEDAEYPAFPPVAALPDEKDPDRG